MHGVVGVDRQGSGHALAHRSRSDGGGEKTRGHDGQIEGALEVGVRRRRQHLRPGQVGRAEKADQPAGDARQDLRREPSPAPANRSIGRDDERKRRQLDHGRRRVEGKVAGQPDLVPLSGTGVEGEPSTTDLPNSIRGLKSSIGSGRMTVVFFSDPISTIVCRNLSCSAPCCDEIT